MSAGLLYVLKALLAWSGAGAVVVSAWHGARRLARVRWCPPEADVSAFLRWGLAGGLALVVSAGLPGGGREPEVPLVWPVAPVPLWFGAGCLVGVMAQVAQAVTAVTREERARRLRGVASWAVLALAFGAWWAVTGEKVVVLRGAMALSWPGVAGVVVLGASSLVGVHVLGGVLRAKSLAQRAAVTVALAAGAVVFCVPLVWLLLTSFKERDDNTGTSGLVWVPRVTRTHAFLDDERPLYSAWWNRQRVEGTVVSRGRDAVELEVERPYPLRGYRATVAPDGLHREPRYGAVVRAELGGVPVLAFVRRELVGQRRDIEVLSPENLKGRRFMAASYETEPVREVGLRWENYTEALEWLPPEAERGWAYLRNTLWIVVMSVVGTLLSCSLVAYGFSRLRFPGRSGLFGLMVGTMMLPGAVTMLPRFLVWRWLGAVDTLVPVWLPSFTAGAFYVFLLRQFFRTVPRELEDAAAMDGCSPLRSWWSVMLPQVRPALAVIGIWTFMGAWNDFMTPLIYVSSSEKMPVSYAVQLFHNDRGGEFGLMMAFAAMASLPVLVVFVLGQRFFVEGVQLSGLGGK